jgi:hypothetical protein
MFAEATGDEFKAAVALWCKSWTQVPAASLPNKDKVLKAFSGNPEKWKRIKAGAMRGWVLCSDDRWYHPVVAEKALAALPGREEFNSKKSAEAERKAREREDRRALFDLLKSHGVMPEWNVSTKTLRALAAPYVSQEARDAVTVSKGEGEKKGEGEEKAEAAGDSTEAAAPAIDPAERLGQICQVLRRKGINIGQGAMHDCAWVTNPKATDALIIEAIEIAKQRKPDQPIKVNYVKPIIVDLLAKATADAAPKVKDWV